jgi:ATP-binding cassette, subfamily B (MDR/TAP), member 1
METEFKEVAFSYPSCQNDMIFRDFSLFSAGKTTTVVGGSGSRKSMVVALIERFYDPNQDEQMNCAPYVVATCQSI